ncbi:hypothetical protein [Amycolatopsis pigmentata]|uniref:DUF2867 domain-containing protein n=1 Tax=Amycolatopsis pigmentata TaxID=450801 RepID=A0ABW5FRI9_9PSEU
MDTSPSTTDTAHGLLADRFAPHPDFAQIRHSVVDAEAGATYAAARHIDFAEVHGMLVDAALWARDLPRRMRNKRSGNGEPGGFPGTPVVTEPSGRPRLRFDDMVAGSDWVMLGERPGEEIAAGAVGRFWTPVIEWRAVSVDEFAAFTEPGYGKIVMSLSVRPYGASRSLLSDDIRVVFHDSASRSRFRLYWALVSPFVKLIQDATLRDITRQAQRFPVGSS